MEEISTKALKNLLHKDNEILLLDCRGVDYYHWEHIPGSVNLRWKNVEARAKAVIGPKGRRVVTYCDGFTCKASVRCFQNLQREGYTNVLEYSGGLADWKANGLPTVSDTQYKVAPNVYRFPEQIFYGEKVGSYLIEETDFILIVDGPQQLTEEHEDFIGSFDKPIKVFMTHNPTAGEADKLQKKYGAQIYLHKNDRQGKWLTVKPDVLIGNGFHFNEHLEVIHTPGHTLGSAVLLDTKQEILFSGDHIQGDTEGSIHDFIRGDDGVSGDPKERLSSASKLMQYDFEQIFPFHYEMIRDKGKLILASFLAHYESNNH